ncbi:uncharacterized protein LOC120331037 [Styela clava]
MTETKSTMDALTGAKTLPMKEKLKLLDQEIRRLHKACTDAGYKPEKIKEVAKPMLKAEKRGRVKKATRIGLYVLLATIAMVGLNYCEPTSYAIRVVTKKFMVAILPYYDWTWPFLSECILENPYYDPPQEEFTEENCLKCITELTPITNVTDTDPIAEKIYSMQPVIVSDAMTDWRATTEKVTLDTFIELYATDERTMKVTEEKQTNHFRTTKGLPKTVGNVTAFAKWVYNEAKEGRYPNFTAQWSNIGPNSYKALHYYYTKPYFLPSMCEPIRGLSYLMMARQNATEGLKGLFLRPRQDDMGIWIAQVSGRFEFILNPIRMCQEKCSKVRFVLEEGQILNVPTALYQITYRPNSTEGVGIAVGYEFQ